MPDSYQQAANAISQLGLPGAENPYAAVAYALINKDSGKVGAYVDANGRIVSATPAGHAEVVTATRVITAAESGQTFFLNSATEFDCLLPALAIGLNYRFIVAAAPSGASYTVTGTDADKIIGQIYTTDVNSATDPDFNAVGDPGDVLNFVDGKAIAGDSADFFCDGVNWYSRAFCSVFDAITITG